MTRIYAHSERKNIEYMNYSMFPWIIIFLPQPHCKEWIVPEKGLFFRKI